MPDELHELRDMRFDFLSLVPNGDNPEATVELLKARYPEDRDGSATRNPEDGGTDANVGGMPAKQPPATEGAQPDEGGTATDAPIISKEALEAILKQNELLAERNEMLEDLIAKAAGDDEDDDFDDEDDDLDGDEDDDEGEPEPTTKAKPAKAAKVEKTKTAEAAPAADEDIVKNHPAFRRMQAEMERLSKQLEETSEVAKEAEEARLTEIFKGRAEKLSALGMENDELAGLLRKAYDAYDDLEDYRKVETLLAKAARIAEESDVFKEAGRAAGAGSSSKLDELLAKSVGDEGLTKEQRMVKAMREDPSLYDELDSELIAASTNGRAR